MSPEPSHESPERTLPKSSTSVETGHSSVDGSNEEKLPLPEVALVQVPPDSDALMNLLLVWINTPDWPTSQTYLHTHGELLTESAERSLATLISFQTNQQARENLSWYQQLLLSARRQGVESAYENLIYQKVEADNESHDGEELEAQLLAWLQMPDWDSSQAYLQTHPQLRTERAEQLLEQFKDAELEEEMRWLIDARQKLLHQARTWEITGVYEIFQLAEQMPLIDDQEWETLLRQVEGWLHIVWKRSRTYLKKHPLLLTSAAESLLARLWLEEQDYEEQIRIARRLQTVQHARTYGIVAVYSGSATYSVPFDELDEMEALEETLINFRRTLFLTHPDSPDRADLLNKLGQVLYYRYEHTEKLEDLEQAISLYEQAVDAPSVDSPDWPGRLNELGLRLYDLYKFTGRLDILKRTIAVLQYAVDMMPSESNDWLGLVSHLGVGLYDLYEHTGKLEDLEQAITAFQHVVDATSLDSPDYCNDLNSLGNGLLDRYKYTGKLEDLEQAISRYQQAVDGTLPDSPDRFKYLSNLGNGWYNRYVHTKALDDLERVITVFQQALNAMPSDSPDRRRRLTNLGDGLLEHYERTGKVEDLQRAITIFQQALDMTPSDSPDWPLRLTNLGRGLSGRYALTRKMEDLEQTISVFQQALDATPPDDTNFPNGLTNLAIGLHERYVRTRRVEDLELAISLFQRAVDAMPPDFPDYPIFLDNLNAALLTNYARVGGTEDPGQAVSVFAQVGDVMPADSPDQVALLASLGNELLDRYERLGVAEDLEQAIAVLQLAMDMLPDDAPDRFALFNNLGNGLHERYERMGGVEDLELAITLYQQALEVMPPDDPNRPVLLSSLASGLRDRYKLLREVEDLELAITLYQQAVDEMPPDAPDRSGLLTNLGNGFHDRYARTGAREDLERAISLYLQALEATPVDSAARSLLLNNLGTGLRDRYKITNALADLERAISLYLQALEAAPPNSPSRSLYLSNLGLQLHTLYARTGAMEDLERVITTWETNWSLLHQPFVALPIAYQLKQQWQVVEMAGSLVTAYLERSARRRPNVQADLLRTLEVAEGSKSRLLTQLVGRGPLLLPAGLSAEVVAREQSLLRDLTDLDALELGLHDQPISVQQGVGNRDRLQRRQANLIELERLWDGIARLGPEGAEYVALRRGAAATWKELAHVARELGPTTMLISFFITPEQVLLLMVRAGWRWPRVSRAPFNKGDWDNLMERFSREIHFYTPGMQRRETWDLALRQLLTQAQRHLAGVERIVLAPAQNGHLLPWSVLMERAGWRTPAGLPLPLITLPALGVLAGLRRRPRIRIGQALVIGNPTGDLPYAEDEAREMAARFGTVPLLGSAATKEAILVRLANASIIHLATHAFFDLNNPLESGVVLADGILTAREMLQQRLQVNLLILSACESGQVGTLGGEELAGIGQAFLQAGARSLLVSLWQVNDPATAALMQAFYNAWQAGADKAVALRQAMTQIQHDPRWTHPYYWGAFVLQGDWD